MLLSSLEVKLFFFWMKIDCVVFAINVDVYIYSINQFYCIDPSEDEKKTIFFFLNLLRCVFMSFCGDDHSNMKWYFSFFLSFIVYISHSISWYSEADCVSQNTSMELHSTIEWMREYSTIAMVLYLNFQEYLSIYIRSISTLLCFIFIPYNISI